MFQVVAKTKKKREVTGRIPTTFLTVPVNLLFLNTRFSLPSCFLYLNGKN